MRVTYYGELDPFSGGIAQRESDLARAVGQLQLALLFSDVVIVPPGNLLEHALTLPAFEALGPFVAAGRLTTTTDPSSPGPHALIDERVQLYLEERARASGAAPRLPIRPKPLTIQRRRSIEEVRDRWQAILPSSWTLARDVDTVCLSPRSLGAFCGRCGVGAHRGGRRVGRARRRSRLLRHDSHRRRHRSRG